MPIKTRRERTQHGRQKSQATVRDLEARIALLEERLLVSPSKRAKSARPPQKVSRSVLLKLGIVGGAAALGAVAGSSVRPNMAFAAPSTADHYTAVGADAGYTPDPTIGFDASDPNAGFKSGVSAFGSKVGVVGFSSGKNGAGVEGQHFSKQFSGYGVAGATVIGTGVLGESLGRGTGASGLSAKGIGLHGRTGSNAHAALYAENSAGGDGVHGTSFSGRGGVFAGPAAGVQLVPTRAKSHPQKGRPGDLVVDGFHRLWYCHRGGNPAEWKQIA